LFAPCRIFPKEIGVDLLMMLKRRSLLLRPQIRLAFLPTVKGFVIPLFCRRLPSD